MNFLHYALVINYAAPHTTATATYFKHIKVNILSYNGATVAHECCQVLKTLNLWRQIVKIYRTSQFSG